MKKYKVWNKWGHLNAVALGSCYPNGFFEDIEDAELRDSLSKLLEETNEDLDGFEKVLKEWGADVYRTKVKETKISQCLQRNGYVESHTVVPSPPMFPRDHNFVMGDKLFRVVDSQTSSYLNDYNTKDIVDLTFRDNELVSGPHFTVVGKDLYFDIRDSKNEEEVQEKVGIIQSLYPDVRINKLFIGGHGDGAFACVKEGAIMTLVEIQRYQETFPDWDVCYLENESWNKVRGFTDFKEKLRGKWWIPGAEQNDALMMYVETWLQDWVGYVEESVFDLNVLMLDDKHMCVANPNNEIVKAFAKKHNIELVHVPWRHRYFWDGGLHCLTLDLNRDGVMEDYFPERKDSIVVDKGFE